MRIRIDAVGRLVAPVAPSVVDDVRAAIERVRR
jgi:hypothetical protein